jgi:hypothetical protein
VRKRSEEEKWREDEERRKKEEKFSLSLSLSLFILTETLYRFLEHTHFFEHYFVFVLTLDSL